MDKDYPPNPTGMTEEMYRRGVDILQNLVDAENDSDIINHINGALCTQGVDAALYLLYYGHMVKVAMYDKAKSDQQILKDFKQLLQTAASIGAYIGRERMLTVEKFDKMWDVPYDVN